MRQEWHCWKEYSCRVLWCLRTREGYFCVGGFYNGVEWALAFRWQDWVALIYFVLPFIVRAVSHFFVSKKFFPLVSSLHSCSLPRMRLFQKFLFFFNAKSWINLLALGFQLVDGVRSFVHSVLFTLPAPVLKLSFKSVFPFVHWKFFWLITSPLFGIFSGASYCVSSGYA